MKLSHKIWITLLVVSFLIISFYRTNYNFTYFSTLFILFIILTFSRELPIRILSLVYLIYFGLGAANISTYRGEISPKTMTLYSALILLSLLPFFFTKFKQSIFFETIITTPKFGLVTQIHMIIAWVVLSVTFILYGNILLNQELRFKIPPSLGYIIKSSLAIPLFYTFIKEDNTKKKIIKYILLPIMPSLIIGSRGNVLMILICSMLIYLTYLNKYKRIHNGIKKIKIKNLIFSISLIGMIVILPLFYIRRIFNSSLQSPLEMISYYNFASDSFYILLILPFHTAFRETIGISNVIINNNYINNYTSIPLVFQELATVLPGDNLAPGKILGKEIIGSVLDAGLTPGLLGGTYIDFGYVCIFFGFLTTILVSFLLRRYLCNARSLIIGFLSLVEYIHFFHRGFLKLEYFTTILIVIIYINLCKKPKKSLVNGLY
jgi:oligosaccharide repeat unit polymerase